MVDERGQVIKGDKSRKRTLTIMKKVTGYCFSLAVALLFGLTACASGEDIPIQGAAITDSSISEENNTIIETSEADADANDKYSRVSAATTAAEVINHPAFEGFGKYVHESFPHAMELSKKGYNAFALEYRIAGQQAAVEDLAAAITFVFEHAEELGVSYFKLCAAVLFCEAFRNRKPHKILLIFSHFSHNFLIYSH